jgi:hypothetical protein
LRLGRRDLLLSLLLVALPAAAHAPAWTQAVLLGPGDGAALHLPLKAAVWSAYRRGELPSWNPTIFLGAPLLAGYRPGAFHPLVAALTPLPSFAGFQALVLLSLGGAGVATFFYLRALGGERVGAYVGALCFALGPYLVGHLGDTATLTAAPFLPLSLLALEAVLARPTGRRAALLTAAATVLLLAGSPEAARAGAAVLGVRLALAAWRGPRAAAARAAIALAAAVLLAAPQLVPTLLAARDAGRAVTSLAAPATSLPGFTGLVLRYVSHTPAAPLALAGLPLLTAPGPVRMLAVMLVAALALQWGQPLAAPGALPLAFDLLLCLLAGLSLSAQWESRRDARGRRLRAWFLAACLGSAAALSVAAAALGPLPQTLAGAAGVLALALILYFPQAASPSALRASLWLLPLTVAFVLQPHGRQVWSDAPTRAQVEEGTVTRQALTLAMGQRRGERALSLVFQWPHELENDLAYGGLASFAGRRSANGYDPLVPLRTRTALGGMSVGGILPDSFLRSSPRRLLTLGIRWLQVPVPGLRPAAGREQTLALPLDAGQARFFALSPTVAGEVHLATCLQGGLRLAHGEEAALLSLRLATGRALELPLRGGVELARGGGGGDCHQAVIALPARYRIDGLGLELRTPSGRLLLWRIAVRDRPPGLLLPVTPAAGFASDTAQFREVAVTPGVRLLEVAHTLGPARVVARLRPVADETQSLALLDPAPDRGFDPRAEATVRGRDLEGVRLPADGRAGRAEVVQSRGNRLELRAEGPGILVAATAWDPGWRAQVDDRAARVLRVDHAQIGVPLERGNHRVVLQHETRGFLAGVGLAGATLVALLAWWRSRP